MLRASAHGKLPRYLRNATTQEVMDKEAELIGRSCTALLAREFWRRDQLVEAYCVVFVQDDRECTWKITFDDEDYTWKVKQTDERPIAGFLGGDWDRRWPIADLLGLFPVKGECIAGFAIHHDDLCSEARLEFSSGHALKFSYAYTTEVSTVVLEGS